MATARSARRKFIFRDLPERYFTSFAKMRSEKQLCDISICVEDVQISAHRLILGAVIPFFGDKLSERVVKLVGVEPSAVACLIDYAYTSEVNVDTANVESLLCAADFFGIDEVKQACCDFLSDGLEPETVRYVRDLAIRLRYSTLFKKADSYMTKNFNTISQTSDFLEFSPLDLERLIKRDDLNVEDEGKVLDAVFRWVKKSPENRMAHLLGLLCRVRLPLISPQYLEIVLQKEELITKISCCRNLVQDAIDYVVRFGKQVSWHYDKEPRRKKNDVSEILCIFRVEVKTFHTSQGYDFLGNKFFSDTRKFIDNPGSAVHLNKYIYFFHLCTTMQFDTTDRSMISMCRMPTLRDFFGATIVKDKIYICGGRLGSVFSQSQHQIMSTNVVECFDPVANTWSTVREMPTRRGYLSAVTLNECIFAIGGRCENNAVNTVEMYEPEQDSWKSMTPMLKQRYHAGAASLNGIIYVCGGVPSDGLTTSCEMYEPAHENWVPISPISYLGYSFVLLPFQQKLYAIGGLDSNHKTIRTVGVYDPETDTWTLRRPMNSGFFPSDVVVMDAVDVLPEMEQLEIE